MTHVRTPFFPQEQGFHFVNRFELNLPVRFQLPFGGAVDLSHLVFGLCGGMCFAALDYFKQQEPVPDYAAVEEIDRRLYAYLCDRQLDSLKLGAVLKVIQWMMLEDGEVGVQMARNEIPKLRRSLERGEPAVLALVRTRGVSDPTQNHQVLAIGYEFNEATRQMKIDLYDPNHPGRQPSLSLNLAKPSAGIQISQSTGEPLRGFFIIGYRPQAALPRPPISAPVSFDLGAPQFTLRWPVDSHRVNQYFGENPDSYKPFGLPGHEGLDLYAPSNANIYAAADGEITNAGHPKDHPYGLQIRMKHDFGGKVYRTVYAHLAQTLVQPGQKVKAGDLIGLADNTGNSFGSHLHLTLKIDGAKTPGYPNGIVDPWPFLKDADSLPADPGVPAASGVVVFTSSQLNLKDKPDAKAEARALIAGGEALSVLGDAAAAKAAIGQQGNWLQVQTASGAVGYAPAWQVQSVEKGFPPSDLVIYPLSQVNLRSGPGTAFQLLAALDATSPLTVLGDAANARDKLGRDSQWLLVQTQAGQSGYVAAWLVHSTAQASKSSDLAVVPTTLLNVRARPSTDSNTLTVAGPGDRLGIVGDKDAARQTIGKDGQWLNVRAPAGHTGFVAAWLVAAAAGGTGTGGTAASSTAGRSAATSAPATGGAAARAGQSGGSQASAQLQVYPTADINVRAQASANSPRVAGAFFNDPLLVLDPDQSAARAKIGLQDNWVYVQTKDGTRGWAAAWFLSLKPG